MVIYSSNLMPQINPPFVCPGTNFLVEIRKQQREKGGFSSQRVWTLHPQTHSTSRAKLSAFGDGIIFLLLFFTLFYYNYYLYYFFTLNLWHQEGF